MQIIDIHIPVTPVTQQNLSGTSFYKLLLLTAYLHPIP